ncbi:hypothetical protein KI387_010143, partial [Taxus chinensis]
MAKGKTAAKGKMLAKKSPRSMPRPPPKVNKNKSNKSGSSKRSRVPRLPFSLKKELDILHPTSNDEEDHKDDENERLDGDEYEYEEGSAQEDTKKNKRYDKVDSLEYELPSDFEDEEIDEDTVFGHEDFDHSEDDLVGKGMVKVDWKGKQTSRVDLDSDDKDGMSESQELSGESKQESDSSEEDNEQDQLVSSRQQQEILSEEEEEEEDDGEKHQRMLQDVTGKTFNAFGGKKRRKKVVISEAYPESEFNLGQNPSGPTESLSVRDLMAPLYGNSGFGSLRKRMQQLEKNVMPLQAPLPKIVQARLERKAAYANTKEDIKKWQPIVKKNREATTINLAKRVDLGKSSTGAIAFAFKPTTDLEKNIASLLQDTGVVEAQTKDGAELLELNKERMTLRHKNTSKWAKRVLKRGLQTKDEGTRVAIAEQLRMNTLLTRKIHSMNDGSSSNDSSSEDDDIEEISLGSDGKLKSQIIANAKEDTLKVLEDEGEEYPKSGILSLPFMVRGMEKRKKQAHDEAVTALEEYESALRTENTDAGGGEEASYAQKGRLVFGELTTQNSKKRIHKESKTEFEDMLVDKGDGSDGDSESDMEQDSKQNCNNTNFKDQVKTDTKLASERLNLDFNGLHGVEDSLAPPMIETAGPVFVDACAQKNLSFDSRSSNLKMESTAKMVIPKVKKTTPSEVPNSNKWLFGEPGAKTNKKLPAEINAVMARKQKKQERQHKQENEGETVFNVQENYVRTKQAVSIAGTAKVDSNKIHNKNDRENSDPGMSNREISDLHRQRLDQIDSSCDSEEEPEREAISAGMALIDGAGSQTDLIQRAFAGDDVEAEFEQAKAEALNEEVPASEVVGSLPGWGQWTHIQQKKGLPSWILQQQEEEKRKREEALRKRKDAKLKFVVISEKADKKATKYNAPSLPFPYQSKEVFERSMRMPIGPRLQHHSCLPNHDTTC